MLPVPPELLDQFFDYLDSDELLTVSHVSSSWRSVARQHPSFWRDLSITTISPKILSLTTARLSAGGTRTCNITIDLDCDDPLIVPLLYNLGATLGRIKKLRVLLRPLYILGFCDILSNPAPELEVFDIGVHGEELHAPLASWLHPRLLGSRSGRLKTVYIYNMLWPDVPVPAFASVTFVALGYMAHLAPQPLNFPPHIFTVFPQLSEIILTAETIEASPLDNDTTSTERFSRLKSLKLDFCANECDKVLSSLPCSDIPQVQLTMPSVTGMHHALGHLQGPLSLAIDFEALADTYIAATFSPNDAPDQSRIFLDLPGDYDRDDSQANKVNAMMVLSEATLVRRIVALTVRLSLFNRIAPFVPLENVIEDLVVVVDDVPPALFNTINLPRLQRFTVRLPWDLDTACLDPLRSAVSGPQVPVQFDYASPSQYRDSLPEPFLSD